MQKQIDIVFRQKKNAMILDLLSSRRQINCLLAVCQASQNTASTQKTPSLYFKYANNILRAGSMLLLATNWTFFRGQSCGGGDSRPTIDAADGGFLNGRGRHDKNVVGDDAIRNNNSCFECTFESFDRLMDEIDDNGRIFEDALPVGSCSFEPDRNSNRDRKDANDENEAEDINLSEEIGVEIVIDSIS